MNIPIRESLKPLLLRRFLQRGFKGKAQDYQKKFFYKLHLYRWIHLNKRWNTDYYVVSHTWPYSGHTEDISLRIYRIKRIDFVQCRASWGTSGTTLHNNFGPPLTCHWSTSVMSMVHRWSTIDPPLVHQWLYLRPTTGPPLAHHWVTIDLTLAHHWSTTGPPLAHLRPTNT